MQNHSDPETKLMKSNQLSSRAAISNANYMNWRIQQLDGEVSSDLQLPKEVQAAITKVQQRGATKESAEQNFAHHDFKEAPRLGPRSKSRGGKHLSITEKIQIVHDVIVQHKLLREVAADYQITVSEVSLLSRKAQKNKKFLKDLISQKEESESRKSIIELKLRELNQGNAFLDSAQSVKATLKKDLGLEASEFEIKKIMREELGMRFRKVIPISIHGNSAKNLVLRQQFAKAMINLLR